MPKCRRTSASDVPAINIANAFPLSFPLRIGLVAFVNVEELSKRPAFYGQEEIIIIQLNANWVLLNVLCLKVFSCHCVNVPRNVTLSMLEVLEIN